MSFNAVKEDEVTTGVSKRVTLARLFRYLLNYKGIIFVVTLIMLICLAITIVNPLLVEYALNVCVKNKDWDGLVRLGIIAVCINVVLVILIKVRMYLMAKLSNSVLVTIRQKLYEHIQTLSFRFFDSRPTGKIMARVTSDVNSLKDVLANAVTTLLPDFLTICAVIVVMLIKNIPLALAALCNLPLMVLGVFFIEKHAHKGWQDFRTKSSTLTAFIHEDVSGMRVVQGFSAEKETEGTFDELMQEHRSAFIRAVRYADGFGPLSDFCWGIANVCLYYVGIKLTGADMIEVGTLIAFTTFISMFWQPVQNLSSYYNQLITNIAGAERVFEIMDTKPDIYDAPDCATLPEVQGTIDFDHVSFAYAGDTQVLSDVSFHVEPGETIALVGPTGAGKTTIVNLISRFYDVTKGSVRIDGYDLRDVSLESLRLQMGVMTQDNFLFSGTVRENILYGKPDATEEEVIAAAKAVHAHDFIMKLENGYDTKLAERGQGLSVGQRQLLAFARTMVSMPKVLILDEATSSIDTHTELLVQQGIEALLAGRTSFVIAHRLSTIQKANRIFVVDNGGIVEAGTPQELMEKKGAYYELYMAQFRNIA